jgi:Domain of unknown function (DUF397)
MVDWSTADWVKSSRSSGNGQCLMWARADGVIGVRDSKLGNASPVLEFTPDEWQAFIAGAKDGEFDL